MLIWSYNLQVMLLDIIDNLPRLRLSNQSRSIDFVDA